MLRLQKTDTHYNSDPKTSPALQTGSSVITSCGVLTVNDMSEVGGSRTQFGVPEPLQRSVHQRAWVQRQQASSLRVEEKKI